MSSDESLEHKLSLQDPAPTAGMPADPVEVTDSETTASGQLAQRADEGSEQEEQETGQDDGRTGESAEATSGATDDLAPSSANDSSPSTSSSADDQPASASLSSDSSPASTAPEAALSASEATEEPAATPPSRPRYIPPPPPSRGILRPPQSSHAGPTSVSRFSFRRDVLQSLTAGAPAGAVAGGVQEAVGSAASVAGGLLGSAWKRLGQVAGAVQEQAQGQGAAASVKGMLPNPSNGTNASTNASSSSLPSSSASTLVDPSSSTATLASTSASPAAPPPAQQHPLPIRDLRRVRFRVGRSLSITYPINRGTLEPIAPEEEGRTREKVEGEWRARKRLQGFLPAEKGKGKGKEGMASTGEGEKKLEEKKEWTGTELQLLYAEICKMREEPGIDKIKRAFRENPTTPPKTLDLAHTSLSLGAAEALADLLSVDWGCKKVVLDSCGLDDDSLRPILNALLVSASVPTLSLANNKRIKQRGWKLLAVFVRKASFLRYLDLSDSTLDRRAAEWLVVALNPIPLPTPPPPPPHAIAPPVPAKPAGDASGTGESEGGGEGKAWKGAGAEDGKKEEKAKKVAGPWDEEEDSSDEEESKEQEEPAGSKAEEEVSSMVTENAAIEPVEQTKEEEQEQEQETEVEVEVEEPKSEPVEPLFDSAPLLKDDEEDGGAVGAVMTLKLDNCGWKGGALEALANGLRTSQLKHVSLRRNRINAQNAVHLAVLIRDYPLSSSTTSTSAATSTTSTLASDGGPFLVAPWAFSLNNGGGGAIHPALESPASITSSSQPFFSSTESGNSVTARQRPLPPPPSSSSATTQATGHDSPGSLPSSASEDEAGGILVERPSNPQAQAEMEAWRLSEARMRLRRQVDELPRVGALLTLDVKGNDIRNGVGYIAQVLKRNRTLKVLNLSENKIDVQGLVAVAESLKFNNCLETLDLSFNPCCGPTSIDGVLALRSALMVTRSLKRVFLNHTALTSDGAIALAEFLPESRALHHLDLTDNQIDISGVLALSVSLKLNTTIRCLDLNIPFDDPDFSRLSFDILQTCVRNTELAQAEAEAKASKRVVIAQPIRKSALASNLEAQQRAVEERQRRRREEAELSQSTTQMDIFAAAAETRDVVAELLAVDQAAVAKGEAVEPSGLVRDALMQVQLCEAQLSEAVTGVRQGEQRERAEILLIELASLLDLAKALYDKPPPTNGELPAAANAVGPASRHSDDDDEATPHPASPVSATAASSSSPPAFLDIPPPASPSSSSSPRSPRSPVESSSRAMVAEESEVFRKGLALGVDDVPSDSEDEEGAPSSSAGQAYGEGLAGLGLGLGAERDVSGEELKREILLADEKEIEEAQKAQGKRRGSRGSFSAEEAERPRREEIFDAGDEAEAEEAVA